MFKKSIIGVITGIIVIAVVMTAGCVSSVVSVDDDEQIEEQAPVEIVCAQDTVDEPVWFVTPFSCKKSDSVCEEVTPNLHFKKPSHAIVTSTCVKSEEDPGWFDVSQQEIITPYKPDLFGFNFNRDFGINEPVEDPWMYEWDFGIKEPVEGAGLEGDPWLYEPVEPTGTKAWFGIDPHDEDESKDQSVKFPGHQVQDSVPKDEFQHKIKFDYMTGGDEASEKEPVGDSAEDETDQKSDEDIPRFGSISGGDEAFDADEPEEDHTEDKPSVPEVVTDGRKEPTSSNPNTGADHRMNCAFNPNQAGHDGGALSPDKDRHADKGFDEGSFARAA